MLKLKIFIVILFLLFSINNVYAACVPSQYEEYMLTYLAQLEKRQIPVFCCSFNPQDGKAVFLIIEWGSANGILIEKDDCTITNLSKIFYSDDHHQLIVEDTHGGVYSYDRVSKLLQTAVEEKFILLRPDELRGLLNIGENQ